VKYKVYVVSLPERKDRRERVKNYFPPFKNIEIVDAYSPETRPRWSDRFFANDYFPDMDRAKACFASFYNTYKRIAEGDEEWGIQVCDDTVFHPDIINILDKYNPPEDCGFIAMNNFRGRAQSIQQVINQLYTKAGDYQFYYNIKPYKEDDETWGIIGAIHRDCAKKICKEMWNMKTFINDEIWVNGHTVRVDWTIGLMFNWYNLMDKWNIYKTTRPIVFDTGLLSEVSDSSINRYKIENGKLISLEERNL
tara:strand:- start:68 stop:820 length:753 start_codon:yes stop_codon:yes gene_type:complete